MTIDLPADPVDPHSAQPVTPFACPVCGSALFDRQPVWQCLYGHHFDVARQGYINLLPVQRRHSQQPGDTPQSLAARRQFLQGGYFAPIRDALSDWLQGLPLPIDSMVMDLGCGEGYYTTALTAGDHSVLGIDISKVAIQKATVYNRSMQSAIQWLVASAHHLPLADNTVAAAVSLFAPVPEQELQRVLQPSGHLLIGRAGPDHLLSLRQHLFDQVKADLPPVFNLESFELMATWTTDFSLSLSADAVASLLAMTPYGYKVQPARQQHVLDELGEQGQLQTSVQVHWQHWRRQ